MIFSNIIKKIKKINIYVLFQSYINLLFTDSKQPLQCFIHSSFQYQNNTQNRKEIVILNLLYSISNRFIVLKISSVF